MRTSILSGVCKQETLTDTKDFDMTTTATLNTITAIAQRLGVPPHRVRYVVRSRDIKPTGMAGNLPVFADADVPTIELECRKLVATCATNEGVRDAR